MAQAALSVLPVPVTDGLVISKYGHFEVPIQSLRCFEAGHPVPDENSVAAAEAALLLSGEMANDNAYFVANDNAYFVAADGSVSAKTAESANLKKILVISYATGGSYSAVVFGK